ncbi:MAG: hypothetical protein U0522_02215 [Candidatus Paceibacterota bacterium]
MKKLRRQIRWLILTDLIGLVVAVMAVYFMYQHQTTKDFLYWPIFPAMLCMLVTVTIAAVNILVVSEILAKKHHAFLMRQTAHG